MISFKDFVSMYPIPNEQERKCIEHSKRDLYDKLFLLRLLAPDGTGRFGYHDDVFRGTLVRPEDFHRVYFDARRETSPSDFTEADTENPEVIYRDSCANASTSITED